MKGHIARKSVKGTFLIMCSVSLADASHDVLDSYVGNTSVQAEDTPYILTHLVKQGRNGCTYFLRGPDGLERFDLSGELARVAKSIDGKSKISEIAKRLAVPIESVTCAVSQLYNSGLVDIA